MRTPSCRIGLILSFLSSAILAEGAPRSALPAHYDLVLGVKYPNSLGEGLEPVVTPALVAENDAELAGFKSMLPYVFPSPDQEGAGSCLYMALTGTAEWWLARMHPQQSRVSQGPLDLSERYLMNLAGIEEASNGVENWKIDSILLFNRHGVSYRSRDYRFTKGWFKEQGGQYVEAQAGEAKAQYGTEFNWIDHTSNIEAQAVALPTFSREVLFADPASNQWNVGVAPADITQQVKNALRENEAPVLVIYNHYGYWHAVMVVGFDDQAPTNGCAFTRGSAPHLRKSAEKFKLAASAESDGQKRKSLEEKSQRYFTLSANLERSLAERGECNERGVFYVRDSIYTDPKEPLHDYDPNQTGEESHLGKRVVLREYAWLENLSNHVVQIFAQ